MCPRRGGRGWLLSKSASQGTAQVAGLARSLPPSFRLLGAGLRLVGGVGCLCRISGPGYPSQAGPGSAWASLSIFSLLPTPPSLSLSLSLSCVCVCVSLPLTLSVIIPFHLLCILTVILLEIKHALPCLRPPSVCTSKEGVAFRRPQALDPSPSSGQAWSLSW